MAIRKKPFSWRTRKTSRVAAQAAADISASESTPRSSDSAQGFGTRRAVLVVLVSLLLVVPLGLGALAIMRFEQSPTAVLTVEQVASFRPEKVELDGSRGAQVTLTWGAEQALFAPSWAGLVTDVSVQTGDTIAAFAEIAEVDGIKRFAWRTDRPFHRTLARGDKGADVKALQRALKDLKLVTGSPDGLLGPATARAIGEYSLKIGYTTRQTTFDPGWVVFLPTKSFKIARVGLAVGAPTPAVGTAIVEAESLPAAAKVTVTDGTDLPTPITDWEVVVGENGYSYDQTGHIPQDQLAAIATVDPDQLAVTDGTDQSDTAVPAQTITATIRRIKPLTVHKVPAVSVATGADGRHCVWAIADGSGAMPTTAATEDASPNNDNTSSSNSGTAPSTTAQPGANPALPDPRVIFVELLTDRSQPGVSLLTDLPDGLSLVSNPRTALGLVSCPSS